MTEKKPSCWLRVLKGGILALAAILALATIAFLIVNEPVPQGEQGFQTERFASRLMATIDHSAWLSTGAVQWNFDDRQQHLWDRRRNYARVRWVDVEVLIALDRKIGLVYRNGEKLSPEASIPYLNQAYKHWANDSFWLNPISKIMDPGTVRSLVTLDDGKQGLLVTYTSGGVTPGDSYLWLLDENGLPRAWKMWVAIVPIGGLEVSWEGWQKLDTGVMISTQHRLPIGELSLKDVRAARTLPQLVPGNDPFAPLAVLVKSGAIQPPPYQDPFKKESTP